MHPIYGLMLALRPAGYESTGSVDKSTGSYRDTKGYPCNSLDTLMAHSTDTLARSNTAIYDNNASQSDKKKDAKIPIKIMTVVQYFIGEYDLLRV